MWWLRLGMLSKVLPVALLVVITCITFVVKSIVREEDAIRAAKERQANNTDDVELSDEDESVDVEIEDDSEDSVEVELEDDSEEVTVEEVETSVVSTPITQVQGLPPKAIKALQEAKVLTVEQATAMSDEDLLALNGVGAKTVEKIRVFKI